MSSIKSQEAADFLGVSVSWLNKSRMKGTGPVYLKIGGAVRYALPDLEVWLAGQRRTAVCSHANDNQRARRAA